MDGDGLDALATERAVVPIGDVDELVTREASLQRRLEALIPYREHLEAVIAAREWPMKVAFGFPPVALVIFQVWVAATTGPAVVVSRLGGVLVGAFGGLIAGCMLGGALAALVEWVLDRAVAPRSEYRQAKAELPAVTSRIARLEESLAETRASLVELSLGSEE